MQPPAGSVVSYLPAWKILSMNKGKCHREALHLQISKCPTTLQHYQNAPSMTHCNSSRKKQMHKLKLYRLCPAQWTTKDSKPAAILLIFRNSNHKKLHAIKILNKDLHVAHIIEEVLIIAWLFAQTTFPLWAWILISNMQKKIFCCVLLAGDSKYWKPCECTAMCSQPMPLRKR